MPANILHFREQPPELAPIRLQIPIPEKMTLEGGDLFSLSPDGRRLVFTATGPDHVRALWLRDLAALEARRLPGSENLDTGQPFWSPDGRFIVFGAGGKLKKIAVQGGPPQTLCDLPRNHLGGAWNRDGVIILGNLGGSVTRISSDGGTPVQVTSLDSARQETFHALPSFLPDGRHFVYLRLSSTPENSGVFVGSLDSKPAEQSRKPLVAASLGPGYIPAADSGPGHLLFERDGALFAQLFDERKLELEGDPVPVAQPVGSFRAAGYFVVSTSGTLVYRASSSENTVLTRFDRQGASLGPIGEADNYGSPFAVSADGTRAALPRYDSQTNAELWLVDLTRVTRTRFASGRFRVTNPIWPPDGRRVIFASNQDGPLDLYQKDLYQKPGGGEEQKPLFKSSQIKYPTSISSDGRLLLFATAPQSDLWVLPLDGDGKPTPFLQTPFNELDGHFSPDNKWVAYTSNESGRNEVYARPFHPASISQGAVQISQGGGTHPRWRVDGRELIYQAVDGKIMAVDTVPGTALQVGVPKTLFCGSFRQHRLGSRRRRQALLFPAARRRSHPGPVHRCAELDRRAEEIAQKIESND